MVFKISPRQTEEGLISKQEYDLTCDQQSVGGGCDHVPSDITSSLSSMAGLSETDAMKPSENVVADLFQKITAFQPSLDTLVEPKNLLNVNTGNHTTQSSFGLLDFDTPPDTPRECERSVSPLSPSVGGNHIPDWEEELETIEKERAKKTNKRELSLECMEFVKQKTGLSFTNASSLEIQTSFFVALAVEAAEELSHEEDLSNCHPVFPTATYMPPENNRCESELFLEKLAEGSLFDEDDFNCLEGIPEGYHSAPPLEPLTVEVDHVTDPRNGFFEYQSLEFSDKTFTKVPLVEDLLHCTAQHSHDVRSRPSIDMFPPKSYENLLSFDDEDVFAEHDRKSGSPKLKRFQAQEASRQNSCGTFRLDLDVPLYEEDELPSRQRTNSTQRIVFESTDEESDSCSCGGVLETLDSFPEKCFQKEFRNQQFNVLERQRTLSDGVLNMFSKSSKECDNLMFWERVDDWRNEQKQEKEITRLKQELKQTKDGLQKTKLEKENFASEVKKMYKTIGRLNKENEKLENDFMNLKNARLNEAKQSFHLFVDKMNHVLKCLPISEGEVDRKVDLVSENETLKNLLNENETQLEKYIVQNANLRIENEDLKEMCERKQSLILDLESIKNQELKELKQLCETYERELISNQTMKTEFEHILHRKDCLERQLDFVTKKLENTKQALYLQSEMLIHESTFELQSEIELLQLALRNKPLFLRNEFAFKLSVKISGRVGSVCTMNGVYDRMDNDYGNRPYFCKQNGNKVLCYDEIYKRWVIKKSRNAIRHHAYITEDVYHPVLLNKGTWKIANRKAETGYDEDRSIRIKFYGEQFRSIFRV